MMWALCLFAIVCMLYAVGKVLELIGNLWQITKGAWNALDRKGCKAPYQQGEVADRQASMG